MNRKWIQSIAILILALSLAGCGKSIEEQIEVGVANAQSTFKEAAQTPNTTIGNIQLFIPKGYTVEQGVDEMNYILKKDKDSFLLFVNAIETEDSKLHYENLLADKTKDVVKSQDFETAGAFGFSAVVKHSEDEYELIVGSGGIKMTTISQNKKIENKLSEMMQIVRSVQISKK
ncbi:hypothetical protein [Solibacillus sp. CAU 1738]|uniref:hypothetical protein n=1 Tax=Solibacillus sp. CAU 1738 TaxID=3140363 RepID=UPI003260F285